MSGTSKPSLKLFIRSIFEPDEAKVAEKVQTRRDAIVERMNEFKANGKIAEKTVFDKAWDRMMSPDHRNNAGGPMKHAVDQYDEFTQWATRNNVSLRPHFNEVDTLGGKIRFPDLCLAAYQGQNVRGVFPCSDETTVYTIKDYLDALQSGEDWRDWKQSNPSITPDWGSHGDIKFHLIYNTDDTVGKEWEFVVDEYSVQSGRYEEKRGRIDLVFKHKSNEEFLLVEVKPDREGVEKAFGQALSYRYQFLSDRTLPGLDRTDVHLAIAAPEFYKSHEKAAKEVGIRLIVAD